VGDCRIVIDFVNISMGYRKVVVNFVRNITAARLRPAAVVAKLIVDKRFDCFMAKGLSVFY